MSASLDGEAVARAPRRAGGARLLASLAVAYLGIAALIAFYVLPTGIGLDGATLLVAQSAALLVGAVLVAAVAITIRRHERRRASLRAMADALGWVYRSDVGDWLWGGSVDEQIDRSARSTRDHLDARAAALPFDSAERTFVVGDGEGSTMHSIRAVRIPLPSEAPRIALRSRRGGGALSVLPRRPSGRSELRLEGDFSDVFEVSVPTGYETDALYVLTPDLMAIILDHSHDLDLEIVDSTLHVYFSAIDLSDAVELSRFLTVIAALYDRFGRRTMLYRDDAAPPLDENAYRREGDTLSAPARTLKTRVRWWPVIAAVLTPLVPLIIGLVWT
ncbi:hypothetical protein [Microbacterium sp. PMB16]|uniref:hypothetical protein n=1 Tax=Microbacterium sp. PMB16 TaxID=3120157 RepID=UPI003F4B1F89